MKVISILKSTIFLGFFLLSTQIYADNLPMSDDAITSNIKTKIMNDKLLNTAHVKVEVSTDQQVVHFSGTVNSDSEASTLVEIAQSTVDVKDVDTSKLEVKGSKHPVSDTYITAKVKGAFIREKL